MDQNPELSPPSDVGTNSPPDGSDPLPSATEIEAHEEHEEPEKLLATLRGRAVGLYRGHRRLRLITGLALAQVLAGALLVLAHDLPMPLVTLSTTDNKLIVMGAPIFVAALLFISLAWAYLLSGALHSHPVIRVVGLVLYTVAFGSLGLAVTGSGIYFLFAVLALALVWALGLGSLLRYGHHRRHAEAQHPKALRVSTFLATFLLTLALYADGWFGATAAGSHLLFTLALTAQLATLQFVLIPMFVLAAADFGEWSEVAGERVTRIARRRWPLLAVTATVVAVAEVANVSRQEGVWVIPQVGLGVLFLAALAALVGVGRLHGARLPARLPILALIVSALLLEGIFLGGAVYSSVTAPQVRASAGDVSFTEYRHPQPPNFQIEYPTLWTVKVISEAANGYSYAFSGVDSGDPALLYVIAIDPAELSGEGLVTWLNAQRGYTAAVGEADAKGLREFTLSPTAAGGATLTGLGFSRLAAGRVWIVYGVTATRLADFNRPILMRSVESWRPEVLPVAEVATTSSSVLLLGIAGIAWLLVGLVAFAILLREGRRGRRGGLALGAVFVTVVALYSTLGVFPDTLKLLRLTPHIDLAHFPGLRFPGLQAAVGVVTVALVAWMTVRGRSTWRLRPSVGLLLTIAIGLQVVSWLYDLYSQALQAEGAGPVAQAAVILVAFAWDIVMAGGALTAVNGRWFPRQARLLLYFGYVMLTSAAILYFGSFRVQSTGGSVENFFATDFWVQAGLAQIAVPLLATFFLVKAARAGRRSAKPSGLPVESGPPGAGAATGEAAPG